MFCGDDYRVYLFDFTRLRLDEFEFYFHRLLSDSEQERASRFKCPNSFRQFVAGRALLRTALSQQEGIPTEEWEFSFGPNGKPEVSEPATSELLFNLSHQDQIVVLVVGRATKCRRESFLGVGIDLERTPTKELNFDLIQGFFTKVERDYIFEGARNETFLRFVKVWSAKEAFLKASGMGLSRLTPHSNADAGSLDSAVHLIAVDDFRILHHNVATNYILALCLPQDRRSIRYLALTSVLHSANEIFPSASMFRL